MNSLSVVICLYQQFHSIYTVTELLGNMASSNINPQDVVDALETLTHDQAKELFFHLGVDLHVMSNLASDYKGNMCKIHIVQTWFDKGIDVNWNAIIAGLKKIKMNALAGSVTSQHNVECTNTLTSNLTNPPVPPQASGVTQSTITTTTAASDPLTSVVSTDHPATVTTELLPCDPIQPHTLRDTSTKASTQLASSNSFTREVSSTHSSTDPIQQVREEIEQLQDTFTDLMTDTQLELSDKEDQDQTFFIKFRGYLMFLPVSKKAVHVKFFRESENDFIKAENILKLFPLW